MESSKRIKKDELAKYADKYTITDTFDFGDGYYIWYKNPRAKASNVSVGIAAAISAYSRMYMTDFIIPNQDYICAVDTDGIKILINLNAKDVDPKQLGKFKFEGEYIKYVSTGPKEYAGIKLDSFTSEIKFKGIKKEHNTLTIHHLEYLLYGNKLKIKQNKWYARPKESTIEIKEQDFTISCSKNKRE